MADSTQVAVEGIGYLLNLGSAQEFFDNAGGTLSNTGSPLVLLITHASGATQTYTLPGGVDGCFFLIANYSGLNQNISPGSSSLIMGGTSYSSSSPYSLANNNTLLVWYSSVAASWFGIRG